MRTRPVRPKKERPVLLCVTIGVLIAMVLMVAGGAAIATLILNETVDVTSGSMFNLLTIAVAGFCGALCAVKLSRSQRTLLVCSAVALAVLMILVIGNVLFFNGELNGILGGFLGIFLGGAGAFLITKRGRGYSMHHKKFSAG